MIKGYIKPSDGLNEYYLQAKQLKDGTDGESDKSLGKALSRLKSRGIWFE